MKSKEKLRIKCKKKKIENTNLKNQSSCISQQKKVKNDTLFKNKTKQKKMETGTTK